MFYLILYYFVLFNYVNIIFSFELMFVSKFINRLERTYINVANKLVPYQGSRWAMTTALILFYF
jgi:hypothetical protein